MIHRLPIGQEATEGDKLRRGVREMPQEQGTEIVAPLRAEDAVNRLVLSLAEAIVVTLVELGVDMDDLGTLTP